MRCMHHDSRPITASAVARLDCGFCPVTSLPSTTTLTCQLGAVSTSAPSSRKRLSSRNGMTRSSCTSRSSASVKAATRRHLTKAALVSAKNGDGAAIHHEARDELGDLVTAREIEHGAMAAWKKHRIVFADVHLDEPLRVLEHLARTRDVEGLLVLRLAARIDGHGAALDAGGGHEVALGGKALEGHGEFLEPQAGGVGVVDATVTGGEHQDAFGVVHGNSFCRPRRR